MAIAPQPLHRLICQNQYERYLILRVNAAIATRN